MSTRRDLLVATVGALVPSIARPEPDARDEQIPTLLREIVERQRRAPGVVVGMIDPNGRKLFAHGVRRLGDTRPLDGDTVFEIGSVTKVFTALALADMVRTRDVTLRQPVRDFFGPAVVLPAYGSSQIRLIDLANHSSGLPGAPTNLMFRDLADPYFYSKADFQSFLATVVLARAPGVKWEYSNVGASLLADALSAHERSSFDAVLSRRIFSPLGMRLTSIMLSEDQREHLAQGHNKYLEPVEPIQMPGLEGAGAIKSTASDLLGFLAAVMFGDSAAIGADIRDMLSAPRIAIGPGFQQAIGWKAQDTGEGTVFWHGGSTGGFSCFLGFHPTKQIGVVVLANLSSTVEISDVGRHLLFGGKLSQPPKIEAPPIVVTLPLSTLDEFVGRYRFSSDGTEVLLFRHGSRLFYQASGKASFEIVPVKPDEFLMRAYGLRLEFNRTPSAGITSLTLKSGSASDTAERTT